MRTNKSQSSIPRAGNPTTGSCRLAFRQRARSIARLEDRSEGQSASQRARRRERPIRSRNQPLNVRPSDAAIHAMVRRTTRRHAPAPNVRAGVVGAEKAAAGVKASSVGVEVAKAPPGTEESAAVAARVNGGSLPVKQSFGCDIWAP